MEYPATAEYFYKCPANKDGLNSRCKNCLLIIQKEYRRTKKGIAVKKKYRQTEKYKIVQKRYWQTEKGKASKKKRQKTYHSTIKGHLQDIFRSMKQRCNSPNYSGYKYYGRRGIEVCFESSNEFVDYVINELQVDPRGLTIDRIDNNGNYEKGNIRFITHKKKLSKSKTTVVFS